MFDRKPSMPYTIIVKSLINCWDNSEQNAMMLARCWQKNVGKHVHQFCSLQATKSHDKIVY